MTAEKQISEAASVAADKRTLRERVLALRSSFTVPESTRLNGAIAARLLTLPEILRAKSIFCYLSGGGEVATHALVRGWLADGRRVVVPSFDKTQRRYRPAVLRDFNADLVAGHFGLLEPRDATIDGAPADVAIVPGLAFDERGHRLGFGKGYYDVMLRDFGGPKIALAFDWQTRWPVPAGEHDVPMDLVVTETRLIRRK